MKKIQLQKKLVLSALFAALICAGSFIQVPLPGGVPIAIQDMMAMTGGLLLGPVFGGLAVLVFLLLGAIGLPVFTGKAGLHVLLAGPTSGFLWGYLLAAVLGGTILAIFLPKKKAGASENPGAEERGQSASNGKTKGAAAQWVVITLAALLATTVLFVLGIAIGMRIINVGFEKALAIFLLPFIPGNIIKLVLMVLLAKKFKPIIAAYTK